MTGVSLLQNPFWRWSLAVKVELSWSLCQNFEIPSDFDSRTPDLAIAEGISKISQRDPEKFNFYGQRPPQKWVLEAPEALRTHSSGGGSP